MRTPHSSCPIGVWREMHNPHYGDNCSPFLSVASKRWERMGETGIHSTRENLRKGHRRVRLVDIKGAADDTKVNR